MPSRDALEALLDRFDPEVMPVPAREARVRLDGGAGGPWEAVLRPRRAPEIREPRNGRADARVSAPDDVWAQMADDGRAGLDAFRRGRLSVRGNLHLVIGLLAAVNGDSDPHRLRLRRVETRAGELSMLEAGRGDAVVMIHGLGASKASFLPSVAALAGDFRAIAVDLPGFGDSSKPIGAPYDAPYFARAVAALCDALEIERAHFAGNSLGGRVALEVGFRHPERARRLALLAPSLAWLRSRTWARPLKLIRPELGLLQPAPRRVVEAIVRRVVPGSREGWTAAGVDEFLRSYFTPRGRAAFYAAARSIYLEEPHGVDGFWTRLEALEHDALFIWGRHDALVPHRFMRHVERALPAAQHLELDCGHVPQLERPRETHAAIHAFLTSGPRAKHASEPVAR